MSIASRPRPGVVRVPPADPPAAVLPLFDDEPPFLGRPELNPWHPAFDSQLVADLDDFEENEDGQELDENTFPPPADAAGVVLARAPALDPRHFPLVHSLSAEIFEEISGRERFLTVSRDDIHDAAATFGPFFVFGPNDFSCCPARGAPFLH